MISEKDLHFTTTVNAYVSENPRFLQRNWLADEIEKRLLQPNTKFVLLTAEPGMGKSTFMAQLAHDNPTWLRYFIRRDQVSGLSTVGARPFLMQLGLHLAQDNPDLIATGEKVFDSNQAIRQTAQGSEILGISGKRLAMSPFYQRLLVKVSQTVKDSDGRMTGIQIDTLIADPLLLPLKDLQETALLEPARKLAKKGNEQLVILIDALDELRYSRSKDDILEWLININPDDLPDNIRFVLSSRPSDAHLDHFIDHQQAVLAHLPLQHQEGENKGAFQDQLDMDTGNYVENLLRDKRLNLDQYWNTERTAASWSQTAVRKAEGNLGYLDMIARALDHAIEQGATERVVDLLDLKNLPDELVGLYRFFLNQIKYATISERIEQYDQKTRETFTVNIWTAVYRRLLSVMTVAFEPLTPNQWHTLSNVQADIAVTEQAIGELKPFLDFDEGSGRYQFYHSTLPEFLGDAKLEESQDTAELYAQPEQWHRRIGRYYYQQIDARWAECDLYGFRHLPGHLAAGFLTQEIYTLLTDFDWLQAKLENINILELLDDYNYLDPKLNAENPDAPVFLVQQTLRLSSHVLTLDTQQLASQLIGRLQGFEEPTLQKLITEAEQRQSGKTWLRPLHRTLTPPGHALLRTLTGHTGAVNDMAAIPNGAKRHIISASDDRTLKVWDLATEVEAQKTLRGHKDKVTAVAIMPDGKQAVSASQDKTVKVWNLEDGIETASYNIEATLIKPMYVTREGQIAGTIDDDKEGLTVGIWQLPKDSEHGEASSFVAQEGEDASLASDLNEILINPKKSSFAKKCAKGFGYLVVFPFLCSILFLLIWPDLRTVENFGYTFFGIVFLVAIFFYIRFIFWESNDIEVVDLPLKPQATKSKKSTYNKKNRARTKIGRKTAERVKTVFLRFTWTMVVVFAIITVVFLVFRIQELFYVSLIAIFFFVLLDVIVRYVFLIIYPNSSVKAIAIRPVKKQVVTLAKNHNISVRNLNNRHKWMFLPGRLAYKFSTRLKPILAMAITSDGRYVVHAVNNSLAMRRMNPNWSNRIKSRVYLNQLSKHEGAISALVTLSDNKHFVSASQSALKLWNLEKGAEKAKIGDISQVNTLLVAPHEQWIISAANDGALKVWDISDLINDEGRENSTNSNHLQTIAMVADGSQVIYVSDYNQRQDTSHHSMKIRDKSDVIKDRAAPPGFDIGRLDVVNIAPDIKQAVSIKGKRITLWDLQDGKIIEKIRLSHPTRRKRLPKLFKALVNKSNFSLMLFYFKEFIKLLFSDLPFAFYIIGGLALVISLNGLLIVPYLWILNKWNQRHAERHDSSKRLHRSGDGKSRAIHKQLRAIFSIRVGAFVVTPDGRFAVSALYKDVIVTKLQLGSDDKRQKVLRGHTDEVTTVAVTPDGQYVVSASQDNTIRIWQMSQNNIQSSALNVSCAVTTVAITTNGQQIVFATKDHKLFVWNPKDEAAILLTTKEDVITAVALLYNGQTVIFTCRDGTVEVWSLVAKQCVTTYMADNALLRLSVTPKNNTVAIGDENGGIHLLQLKGIESTQVHLAHA